MTATKQAVPLSTLVSIERRTDPNALTHYNQLNSATLQAVPIPTVTMGQAVTFLEQQTKTLLPNGFRHSYLSDPASTCRRATTCSSPSALHW
jgi:multidrug efflux pump